MLAEGVGRASNVERLSNVCEDVTANESLFACLGNVRIPFRIKFEKYTSR